MIRVDYVTLIDGTVEEMRGFDDTDTSEQAAAWKWWAKAGGARVNIIIPWHRIAMIRETEEPE